MYGTRLKVEDMHINLSCVGTWRLESRRDVVASDKEYTTNASGQGLSIMILLVSNQGLIWLTDASEVFLQWQNSMRKGFLETTSTTKGRPSSMLKH